MSDDDESAAEPTTIDCEVHGTFRKFNDFAVVCIECYARLKRLHSSPN